MIRQRDGVNEIALINIFESIQGEGPEQNLPTVFIRTHKCNLRCPWCDTKESWSDEFLLKIYPERSDWESPLKWRTAQQIFDEVDSIEQGWYNKSICLTGGEPLMEENKDFMINELLPLFIKANYSIDIETNGAVDYTPYKHLDGEAASIDSTGRRIGIYLAMDWKMPASKMNDKMIENNLQLLGPQDLVKVVMTDDPADWEELERLVAMKLKAPIYISPCFGMVTLARIPEFILAHADSNVRAQIQTHKVFWEPTKKDV